MGILRTATLQEKTDEELAHDASHEVAAFGELMTRYEGKLLVYIKRKSGVTTEAAEDILQETFLKAYQSINDFDTNLSFSSWIYRITHNQTISQWRKTSVRPEGNSIPIDNDFIEKFRSDDDVVRDLDRDILQKKIGTYLEELDDKYRDVLILRYMEDKSYKEISDIIKKPEGTVATYLSRAKKKFLTLIDEQQALKN